MPERAGAYEHPGIRGRPGDTDKAEAVALQPFRGPTKTRPVIIIANVQCDRKRPSYNHAVGVCVGYCRWTGRVLRWAHHGKQPEET